MLSKLIQFIKVHQANIILIVGIALATFASYNLGKIAAYQSMKTPLVIRELANNKQITVNSDEALPGPLLSAQPIKNPAVVVSKKSKSKLYHFLWCPGASKIAAANKVTFPTEAAALAAGYTLAGNCKK